uniref:Uncharacterized protein n=1 Tax=Glossina brevipalpis TaxID=37001 RepID=A0A1A9WTQ0_9MUSC
MDVRQGNGIARSTPLLYCNMSAANSRGKVTYPEEEDDYLDEANIDNDAAAGSDRLLDNSGYLYNKRNPAMIRFPKLKPEYSRQKNHHMIFQIIFQWHSHQSTEYSTKRNIFRRLTIIRLSRQQKLSIILVFRTTPANKSERILRGGKNERRCRVSVLVAMYFNYGTAALVLEAL